MVARSHVGNVFLLEVLINSHRSLCSFSINASSEVEVAWWKCGLHIGSRLDVKDTVDKWCEAEVLDVDFEAAKVLISYIFWAKKVCIVFDRGQ